jgi:hypothetical protein
VVERGDGVDDDVNGDGPGAGRSAPNAPRLDERREVDRGCGRSTADRLLWITPRVVEGARETRRGAEGVVCRSMRDRDCVCVLCTDALLCVCVLFVRAFV